MDNITVIRTSNTTWWTTQYAAEIPSCGAGDFTTGDGTDLSCSTPTDTTYTADETNITLDGTVFRLLLVDLAELDNSISAFITNAVSDLVNYFTKSEIYNFFQSNNTYVNESATDYANRLNVTQQAWVEAQGYLTSGVFSNFQLENVSNSTPWVQLHTYPTGCTNQFVRDIDDTLTCASVDSGDIANNAVALTTQTSGNYVETVAGTTNEIVVTGADAEGATKTVGLPDNVIITRNMTITGNASIGGHGIRIIGDCINWTIGTTYWAVGSGC